MSEVTDEIRIWVKDPPICSLSCNVLYSWGVFLYVMLKIKSTVRNYFVWLVKVVVLDTIFISSDSQKVIAWKYINLAINSAPVSLWRQLATGYFDHNRWIQICFSFFIHSLPFFLWPSLYWPSLSQWPSVLCALLLLSVDWPNQVKFPLISSQSHWNAQHRTKQRSG